MRSPHSVNAVIYISLLSTLMLTYSCKDKEVIVADQSHDFRYFPIQRGYWTEYAVDSIVHYDSDDLLEMDTAIGSFHFYVREEFDSTFLDGANNETVIINRFRRLSDTLPWTFMNLWTANRNPYSAQKVEDNIRFIRLRFPITSSANWNGNAYNFFIEEDYSYEDLFEPMQFNGLHFDSTVTVLQYDFLSLINRIYKKEIYAAGTGLIYKELDSVTTKNTSNGTIILSGLEYKFNIIDYNH